jgi:hypothetical protein
VAAARTGDVHAFDAVDVEGVEEATMERSGTTVRGGYRAADLVRIAERPGPFASVWLGRSGLGSYDAAAETQADQVRRRLIDLGAPESVAAEIADATGRGTSTGVVALADESGVLVRELLDEPPRHDLVRWGPVPSWCAVIEHRQAQIPVIVVLADRLGADLLMSSARGTETVEVVGDDGPITKSAPGGWSQRRFQQRAENTWEHNAGLVADEVVSDARSLHPELIVLGGDLRAVQAIHDRLPKELRAIAHTITSGRAEDGSDDRRVEDVARLVRTAVAEQTVAVLQALGEEDGRQGRAANGEVETFDALARSQVDVLLVHDDGDDERLAWWSAAHGMAGLDRGGLDVLGAAAEPVQDRLVDVAVTAALRAGASVRVVPDAAVLQDGIGALLRW